MPKFSIVMPLLIQHDAQLRITYACIYNLQAFSYDYELIILQSMIGYRHYSRDTKKILRAEDQYIPFENNPSQAEALNIGISRAKGEYVILIGNDNFVHQDWLSEIEKRLGDPKYQILGCSVDRASYNKWEKLLETHKDTNGIKGANFSYLNFQGLTIKKTILEEVGPFDEQLPFYLWERDYNLRLEDKGYQCGAVLTSFMTTPQSMTRLDQTLPEGINNWWTDEQMAKEIAYYNKKWGKRVI